MYASKAPLGFLLVRSGREQSLWQNAAQLITFLAYKDTELSSNVSLLKD